MVFNSRNEMWKQKSTRGAKHFVHAQSDFASKNEQRTKCDLLFDHPVYVFNHIRSWKAFFDKVFVSSSGHSLIVPLSNFLRVFLSIGRYKMSLESSLIKNFVGTFLIITISFRAFIIQGELYIRLTKRPIFIDWSIKVDIWRKKSQWSRLIILLNSCGCVISDRKYG